MTISFKDVVPKPINNTDLGVSQVWKTDFEISVEGHYLINASSGKGKSTLVNILYGLRQDYTGDLFFDGKNIRDFQMSDWAELRTKTLSIVFQGLDLFPKLTVLENIQLKNRLTDFKSEAEILEFLKVLEIHSLANNFTGNLSMGQQQRVAIIRALCQPFDCLLLDEPFSHLDDANIQKAWQLINEEVGAQSAKSIATTLGSQYNIEPIKTLML